MQIAEVKKQIVDCCQRLWLRGLVANHDGNISYKISQNEFVATPTSFSKKDITESDLLIVNKEGAVLEGRHKVFSEFAIHKTIYSLREDVFCVVHGHPTGAGGLALAGQQIGVPAVPEAIVSLGRSIMTIKNTSHMDVELRSALKDSDAFLITGNGAWSVGQNVLQTYLRLELVEQLAQALIAAKTFGGAKALPLSQVEELLKKRPAIKRPESAAQEKPADDIKKLIQTELEKILSQR